MCSLSGRGRTLRPPEDSGTLKPKATVRSSIHIGKLKLNIITNKFTGMYKYIYTKVKVKKNEKNYYL